MHTLGDNLELAALALPAGERARLARVLIESLDQDPEIEAAWEREISRRVARVESGEATLVPAEEVFAEARRRLNGS
jgi:putative addiction module component (TIGR02574 family)